MVKFKGIIVDKLWCAVVMVVGCLTSPSLVEAQRFTGALEPAPDLGYVAVADPLHLPSGTALGPSSAVAFGANGHLFVFHRGPNPLAEFDDAGRYVRGFGDEIGFERPHGLRIDAEGNLWVTDVRSHFVSKLSSEGEVLMTLGVPGQAGEWDEAAGTRFLNQPNDIAFGPRGEIFVAQGHGVGDPGVLKFDSDGNFVSAWGGPGTEPGEFDIAHSIVVDGRGLVHVADRQNQRIQVFDLDGTFVRQTQYAGLPCGLTMDGEDLLMVSGYSGQIVRLDPAGRVVAAVGNPGDGVGEFGEAHYVAISASDEIFVSDPVSGAVEKFVPR